ncbi:hypothetical protein ACWCOT_23150 [Nonomuraea bangladeshensis]
MTFNRLISGTLSTMIAAALGFTAAVVTTVTTAGPAQAASTPGGQITRSEVLARAQNWVDRNVRYNLTRASNTLTTDVEGDNRYGPDCSGLVSMAWHITANSGKGGNSTDDFESWSGKRYLASLHDLLPGDAILKSGHIELFARWKNPADHSQGAWTYSLNGGADPDGDGWQDDWAKGPTANSHGRVGDESWASMQNYRPIRYNNIVDDSASSDGFDRQGPSSAMDASGALHIFARGTDGSLKHWYWNNGWQYDVPGTGISSSPTVTVDPAGMVHVFATGNDASLKHWYYSNGWKYDVLGTGITGTPTITADASGALQLFARGTDGALKHWYWNNGWQYDVPGTGISNSPTVTVDPGGMVHVFATGNDASLKHWYYQNGWKSETLGTGITGTPTVSADASGALQLFARGTDGALKHWYWNNGWQYDVPGTGINGSPTVTVDPAGMVHVFATGNDASLKHWYYSNGWKYDVLGTGITGTPTVTADASGALQLFARGTDGALKHWYWNNGWQYDVPGTGIA